MTIRHATDADRELVRSLWQEFVGEVDDCPPRRTRAGRQRARRSSAALDANGLFVAERDGEPVGFASAGSTGHRVRRRSLRARARAPARHRKRSSSAVVENMRTRGAEVSPPEREPRRAPFYERLGFREESRKLVLSLEVRERRQRQLVRRDARPERRPGRDRARGPPVRAAAARRLAGSLISPPRERLDRDLRRRLRARSDDAAPARARELCDRMGAVVLALGVEQDEVVRFVLFERGSIVDEYLSVPEHYGAAAARRRGRARGEPRVVSRLTGADPATVRAVARTAASPRSCRRRGASRRPRARDRGRGRRARLERRAGARGAVVVER